MALGGFLLNILKGLGKGLLSGLGISIGKDGADFSGFGQNAAGTVSNIASMEYAAGIRARENEHLTGKEQEQNMFNAKEAALQRDFARDERLQSQEFNVAQAQKQMDFQQHMASTQYQRSVADMQAAGVNPALAMSNGIAGASASGAMAQSSPASSAAASGSAQLQGLSDLLEFAALKSQIDKTKAETSEIEARAEGERMQNAITDAYGLATAKAKLDEINKAIEVASENIKLSRAQRTILIPAQAALAKIEKEKLSADMVYTTWRNEFFKANGYWPGENMNQEFVSLLRWFAGRLDGSSPGSSHVSGEELAKSLDEALKRNDIGNPYRK